MTALALKHDHLVLDGQRFHYRWLRDNCLSSASVHAGSFERLHDTSQASARPLQARVESGRLVVDWAESPPHQSVFPLAWLRRHAYDAPPERRASQHRPFADEEQRWDVPLLEQLVPAWPRYAGPHGPLREASWFRQLSTLGVTILRGMPPEALEPFFSDIGPLFQPTHGPLIWSVMADPAVTDDLATTRDGFALAPHTDSTALTCPPEIQFLYCLESEASGGTSTLVDGFRVAQELRRRHPDAFRLLTRTPIAFYTILWDKRFYYRREAPILQLDRAGRVQQVIFNSHRRSPMELPFEQMESFYDAYQLWMEHLLRPQFQYRIRLQPGDCLMTNNARVLHGRDAFDASVGRRNLQVGYVSWDHFVARWRFEQFKGRLHEGFVSR